MIFGGQQNELMRDLVRAAELLKNPFQPILTVSKGKSVTSR